jgi:microcystin-dependent protein
MGDQPYIGEISIFAGNFAPVGWVFCDGSLLPITQYSALFALIGTMYGGNGQTNFAVPDLRGRSVLGAGSGPGLTPRNIGQNGGVEKVGLGVNELPAHNHTAQSTVSGSVTGQLKCVMEPGTAPNPKGCYIANHENAFLKNGTVDTMNANAVSINTSGLGVSTTIVNTGNSGQHENMHPFLAINYIIAYAGIFPTRP